MQDLFFRHVRNCLHPCQHVSPRQYKTREERQRGDKMSPRWVDQTFVQRFPSLYKDTPCAHNGTLADELGRQRLQSLFGAHAWAVRGQKAQLGNSFGQSRRRRRSRRRGRGKGSRRRKGKGGGNLFIIQAEKEKEREGELLRGREEKKGRLNTLWGRQWRMNYSGSAPVRARAEKTEVFYLQNVLFLGSPWKELAASLNHNGGLWQPFTCCWGMRARPPKACAYTTCKEKKKRKHRERATIRRSSWWSVTVVPFLIKKKVELMLLKYNHGDSVILVFL